MVVPNHPALWLRLRSPTYYVFKQDINYLNTQLIVFGKFLTAVQDPHYPGLDLVLAHASHHLTLHIHLSAGQDFLLARGTELSLRTQVCTLAKPQTKRISSSDV